MNIRMASLNQTFLNYVIEQSDLGVKMWLGTLEDKTFPFVTLNYFNELSNFDVYCQTQLKQFYYHSGLSTLTKCHCEALGQHEFYHHSDILSCIIFHLKKVSPLRFFSSKVYRDILKYIGILHLVRVGQY